MCEHIGELTGKPIPKQMSKKKELVQRWYDVHKAQMKAQQPRSGGGVGGGVGAPPPQGGATPGGAAGDASQLGTPRDKDQLFHALDTLLHDNPEKEIPLQLVRPSRAVADLS